MSIRFSEFIIYFTYAQNLWQKIERITSRKKFKTSSISEGAEESKKSIISGLKNKKSNISKTISYAESNDDIINSKVITQELETLEALVLFCSNERMEKVQRLRFKREDDI